MAPGDTILVNPGEKVPLDGVVTKGSSTLDTKALTGESLPREAETGSEIISGTVNLTSQLEVKVTKAFYDSTVSKILELVENASEQKSKAENFITRFARYYTPAVVAVAVLLAVIPGLVTSDWSTWLYRALSFLVVSCPCALVISIPLSFFAGIGAASRYGILVKGSNYLEKFNRADIFVFDKTGTLTKGSFSVAHISPESDREEVLRLAAIAERDSSHPIARSIEAAYGKETPGRIYAHRRRRRRRRGRQRRRHYPVRQRETHGAARRRLSGRAGAGHRGIRSAGRRLRRLDTHFRRSTARIAGSDRQSQRDGAAAPSC